MHESSHRRRPVYGSGYRGNVWARKTVFWLSLFHECCARSNNSLIWVSSRLVNRFGEVNFNARQFANDTSIFFVQLTSCHRELVSSVMDTSSWQPYSIPHTSNCNCSVWKKVNCFGDRGDHYFMWAELWPSAIEWYNLFAERRSKSSLSCCLYFAHWAFLQEVANTVNRAP